MAAPSMPSVERAHAHTPARAPSPAQGTVQTQRLPLAGLSPVLRALWWCVCGSAIQVEAKQIS